MAVGKNKGLSKGGKKGVKKKIVDPFTRKDWYDVKAPSMFATRYIGKTLVNRTTGTKIASEGLKNRVFEVSLADLQNENDAERSFRKFRLIGEYVQGRNVLTNFHGMDLTTDKLRSVVKKWQTLIEANVDVKTTDGYLLRVFCIGFTLKDSMSQRKTCYAQHTQIRAIRKKMVEMIQSDISKSDLKEVVNKLLPDCIAKDIEKACQGIFPLHDVFIRKVKVLKKPRFDLSKLLELHEEGKGTTDEADKTAEIHHYQVRKMRPCLKASHGLSSVYSLRERGHSWSNIPSNVVEGDNERSAHNERCPRISDEEQPSCKRHRILCVGDTENEKTSGKNDNAHYHSAKWSAVPTEALVHVFSKLSMKDIGRSAQVCRSWHQASQFAELWQHFEFVIGDTDVSHPQPTSPGLIDHVIAHHSKHLKFVVFKTDTSSESTRTACRILSRSLAIDAAPVDDLSLQALASSCSPRSLHLLQMKDCSRVTKQGILTIAGHCNHLRELSLSWTLLSESLIYALSSKEHTHLEYLRVDMCTSHRSCPVVDNSASSQKWKPPSADCWRALINHSPDLALVINVFDGDDAWSASPEYESSYAIQNALSPQPCNFFSSYVPVTHLYFGSVAPKSVLASIAHHCPRLQELVAAGIECGNCEGGDWTGSLLDAELLAIADGCPQLSAIGLGDCEISCKALVEFAGRVGPRLSRLCVNEDSLVEEDEINIEMTSRLVSGLIGQEWNPESVPLW